NEFYVGYSSKVNFSAGDPVENHCYAAALTLAPEGLGGLQDEDVITWSSLTYFNHDGTTWTSQNLSPVVYPTQTGYFVLTLRSQFNPAYGNVCIDRDSVEVSVRPDIGIYIPGSVSIVQDDVINILAKTHYKISVATLSTESMIYSWKADTLFVEDPSHIEDNYKLIFVEDKKGMENYLRSNLGEEWVISERKDGKTEIYFRTVITAIDEVGCQDTLTLKTLVVDKIRIPNVFTPNGDGKNDTWIVPREYLFPNMEVEVFNRWGSPVWVGSGDDLAKGWDGRTKGGNELPVGTYYYVLKYNAPSESGKWDPITGSVTIIR
ncbi:MAG TPA: gliding motility-associated C-terminal domain-containing protein, partial [Tenuifilaceae bacterium]|nr:gliding motility-associated C-terminal domain-containing protein [Tenuifilaceae bacterium]